MRNRLLWASLALAAILGCAGPDRAPEEPAGGAPWGPGCNVHHLRGGLWSFDRAPDYGLSPAAQARVDEVIGELRKGYGGTLVTAPRDDVLDSPAFLAHYLRAFAKPPDLTTKGLETYDYRFERILSRIGGANGMLDDSRLDWDVWRAYLEYENLQLGPGDSAKDLVWMYLEHNFESLRNDRPRLDAWIDRLTMDLRAPGGRPLRRWFLLLLASLTDDVTPKLAAEQEARQEAQAEEFAKNHPGAMLTFGRGTPWNPYIVVYPHDNDLDPDDPVPPFRAAIWRIAREHELAFTVLALDPDRLPKTRNWEIDLAERTSSFWPAHVLDQESWSTEHHGYRMHFYRPIGRRSDYSNVYLPRVPVTDGVYFFTYNARLYVWPKARMDDAAIDMLRVSGLIDDAGRAKFAAQGFAPLGVTLQGQ